MHETLAVLLAVVGLALLVAGDVFWLMQRRRGRAMDLRVTGGLIAAGIALVGVAMVLREG
jgi:hypothetical protein